MTSLRERVLLVWEILDEDPHDRGVGSQAWFARQVDHLTGWQVSEPTVHRWLYGLTPIDARCFKALAKLEAKACRVLTKRIKGATAKLQDRIDLVENESADMVIHWNKQLDRLRERTGGA